MKLLFITLLFISCGSPKKPEPAQESSNWGKLLEKRDNYLEWSKDVRDSYGFIPDCDSLLFSGLSVVGGYPVEIEKAEGIDERGNKTGQWFRTPGHDCYRGGRSGSTISRDMLLGVLWSSYHQGNVRRLERFFKYSERNNWIIGRGDISRTWVTPQIQSLAAEVWFRIGGPDKLYRKFPQLYPKGLDGFAAHLQMLQIALRCELDGEITSSAHARIKDHYRRQPRNTFYQIMNAKFQDGNYSNAIDHLLNDSQYPNDSLPTSEHRCTEYLPQRDSDKDYDTCPDEDEYEVYSGSDLIFQVGLLERFMNGRSG